MAERSKPKSKLPFEVVRSSRQTLVGQVVAGLCRCIQTGFYRPGDMIPATRELAVALGVSRIVTRAAVRELTEKGFVNPRPGVGCVVLAPKEKIWRGNVLLVTRSAGHTYYVNVFQAELRKALLKAGWLFSQVTVVPGTDGETDLSELELYLAHPVALAVVMFDNPDAERALSKAGVPFVTLGNSAKCSLKGCVGHVRYDRSASADDFAAYAASAGAKSVLQAGMEGFDDIGAALRKAGIKMRKMAIPRSGRTPADVAFAACDAFAAKLAKSRNWLPDLIYFSDDYVCAGALAAFADAGVRIPEDVRVATWANRGNCPVHTKPLARMEMDPENDAKKVAAALVDCLEGRSGAFPLTLGPVFKEGKMV